MCLKLPSENSRIMELTQFFSEFVYCENGYHLLKESQPLFEFKSNMKTLKILSALAQLAGHNFAITKYEQY